MTNHPRSPRAKFKVGQVVATPDEYGRVTDILPRFEDGRENDYYTYEMAGTRFGFYNEPELRPLTKKEAGHRVSDKAAKLKK